MSAHQFWSDDFDMDLLKVIPETPELLGDTAHRTLWTVGHESFGRLNHPATWNTHGAFVWTQKPDLQRDSNGWINVHGCIARDPEIECTWLELLRDQWPHHYGFILLPLQRPFPQPPSDDFMRIMYHIRKIHEHPKVDESFERTRKWLRQMNGLLRNSL